LNNIQDVLYSIQLESKKLYIHDLKNIGLLDEEMKKFNCKNESDFFNHLMSSESPAEFVIKNYGDDELERIKNLYS